MRKLVAALALALVAALSAAPSHAAPAKKETPPAAAKAGEVTLKGSMVCGKCELGETKSCQNVLKVNEGGKDVKYYLAQNDVADKSHSEICSAAAKATVKGTVKDEGGKKILTATEIKFE